MFAWLHERCIECVFGVYKGNEGMGASEEFKLTYSPLMWLL